MQKQSANLIIKLNLVLRRFYAFNIPKRYTLSWRRSKVLRTSAVLALFLLILAASATLVPIYNNISITEAATGTAQSSSLTLDVSNSTASVDLSVDNSNGTFVSSDSSNSISFNVSTNNYTGYKLSLSGNDNSQRLTHSSNSSYYLSSITGSVGESSFSANTSTAGDNYNGKWGYNLTINSGTPSDYLAAPTTTSTPLDETRSANSTANNYKIGIGARASYSQPSGTYTGTYILSVVANAIAYSITYADNTGDSSVANLPSFTSGGTTTNTQSGSVSTTSIILPTTIPTRTGYTFKSWCLGTVSNNGTTCTGTEYPASTASIPSYFGIDQTTINITTLYAMWTPKTYSITLSNTSATTSGSTSTTATYGSSSLTSISNPSRSYTISFGRGTNASSASISSTANQTYAYSFNGWWTATSGGTQIINTSGNLTANNGFTNTNSNWTYDTTSNPATTLYAQWNNGTALTLPTITLTGYTCGWSTSSSASSYTYTSGYSGYIPDATRTLYGICVLNTYRLTITFAGSGVSSVQVRTSSGTSGSLMGTVSSSGGYVSGLSYNTSYYLRPIFTSGYELSSWSKTSSTGTLSSTSAANPTFTMGAGNGAVTVTGKSSVVNKFNDVTYFSDFTAANCTATTNGQTGSLIDRRNSKTYTVAKINGRCWMTQNLSITGTISGAYSNFSASSVSIPETTFNRDAGWTAPQSLTDSTYGTYYNYCAATARTSCVGEDTTPSDATQDICPSGWKLPTYTEMYSISYKSGDYVSLFKPSQGGYYGPIGPKSEGKSFWWSSTVKDKTNQVHLQYTSYDSNGYLYTYQGSALGGSGRTSGIYIRCIRSS